MKWLGKKLARVRALTDGPHRVALGMAIGIYIGFVPLLGIKTLLAMGVARLSRGNVIAAAIGVTLHDLLLPVAPLLLVWEYRTGRILLGGTGHPDLPFEFAHGRLADWFHWSAILRLEPPLIVGALVIGIPFGILGYVLCRRFLRPPIPQS